jgi:hypothetical protein
MSKNIERVLAFGASGSGKSTLIYTRTIEKKDEHGQFLPLFVLNGKKDYAITTLANKYSRRVVEIEVGKESHYVFDLFSLDKVILIELLTSFLLGDNEFYNSLNAGILNTYIYGFYGSPYEKNIDTFMEFFHVEGITKMAKYCPQRLRIMPEGKTMLEVIQMLKIRLNSLFFPLAGILKMSDNETYTKKIRDKETNEIIEKQFKKQVINVAMLKNINAVFILQGSQVYTQATRVMTLLVLNLITQEQEKKHQQEITLVLEELSAYFGDYPNDSILLDNLICRQSRAYKIALFLSSQNIEQIQQIGTLDVASLILNNFTEIIIGHVASDLSLEFAMSAIGTQEVENHTRQVKYGNEAPMLQDMGTFGLGTESILDVQRLRELQPFKFCYIDMYGVGRLRYVIK